MRTIIVSEKGKREDNQDFVLHSTINVASHLYIVADGMGGYDFGAKAAKMVAENIEAYLSTVKEINKKEVQMAVNKANLVIRQHKQDSQKKMGATVGGVILRQDKALCFWVGDVKIFQFRDKALYFETKSHTLMNDMIKNGSISDMEELSKFKHVVTRSVQGDVEHGQIDYLELAQMTEKDLLIICSDGVYDILDGLYIQHLLTLSDSVDEAIERIQNTLSVEAKDNFSLIAVIF